jgi:hypothetical protein
MLRFEVLDPRPSELSKVIEQLNEWKNEGFTLIGFEVTVPEQSALLDLNIDPQHSGGDASKSCIEEVFGTHWDINNSEVVCLTSRADLDSVGGMAIYAALNTSDQDISISFRDRVSLVHQADCFQYGAWSPQPLFTQGYEKSELAAIARAVSDFKMPLETRVRWMTDWLNSGTEPDGYRAAYEKEGQQIKKALESGETKVDVYDYIAVVQSSLRAATSIGYAQAPVVIALNEQFPSKNGTYRKFTICQYSDEFIDMNKIVAELQALEPGWGGSPSIIGSPQGESSILAMSVVLEIVQKHMYYRPCTCGSGEHWATCQGGTGTSNYCG